jgi:hypothetical protein
LPADSESNIGTDFKAFQPAFPTTFKATELTAVECADKAAVSAAFLSAVRTALCATIFPAKSPAFELTDDAAVRVTKCSAYSSAER